MLARGASGTGYVKNSGISAAMDESVRETAAENWHDFVRNPRIGGILFGRDIGPAKRFYRD